ncbi:integrase arm-type DNA-binding domain-containing protein [Xanthobacter sp. VTT E-85241]|uniref:tyrosine-type recombinase/integrase n=1 Tax=Roseixanthobacter finlandensis TaxID=3119922 RepID=UPI00372B69E4
MGQLTDLKVRKAGAGKFGDGDGLQLVVSASGAKKWIFRFMVAGRAREMGLGTYPDVSLAEARNAAFEARKLVAEGRDPIEARREVERQREVALVRLPTFADIAALVIADAQAQSTNAKVQYQWSRHLGPVFCGPLLDRPVHEITTLDVAEVLKSVWEAKPEVARKLHPAIRRVFDRARVVLKAKHNIQMLENPANWVDLKAQGFSRPKELSRGRHPSLPYPRMKSFVQALRARDAAAARALEFLILTNVRTDTALRAEWRELDLVGAVWSIPPAKLKDRIHRKDPFRVPLAPRVIEIIQEMRQLRTSDYVFPGQSSGRPLSNMAMATVIRRMNNVAPHEERWIDPDQDRLIVPHGFRATFRVWAEEAGNFRNAIIEEAMGHSVGSAVERAYRRTDVLELRRELMDAWSMFCAP